MKIYVCRHCGNVIVKLEDSSVDVVCCGEKMELMKANTTDGVAEKHVPIFNKENNKYNVNIGEIDHPMLNEHYISWIILEEENGFQIKYLKPGEDPSALFYTDNKVINIYEYCNLHGLWKLEIK